MTVYRDATANEIVEHHAYERFSAVKRRYVVPVEPCHISDEFPNGHYDPHTYHDDDALLSNGPCNSDICDSSIHWLECDGAAYGKDT